MELIQIDSNQNNSEAKKLSKPKIDLNENPEICIWGVVTYVIHAL